jgi:hypothetical protein
MEMFTIEWRIYGITKCLKCLSSGLAPDESSSADLVNKRNAVIRAHYEGAKVATRILVIYPTSGYHTGFRDPFSVRSASKVVARNEYGTLDPAKAVFMIVETMTRRKNNTLIRAV